MLTCDRNSDADVLNKGTAGTWSQQSVVNGELFCCNGGAMSTATSSSSNANNGGTLTTCSCSSDGGDACMGIYCDACGIGMEEDPTRGCCGCRQRSTPTHPTKHGEGARLANDADVDTTTQQGGRSSIDVSIDTGASSSSFAAMPPPTAAAVAVVVAVGVAAAANML